MGAPGQLSPDDELIRDEYRLKTGDNSETAFAGIADQDSIADSKSEGDASESSQRIPSPVEWDALGTGGRSAVSSFTESDTLQRLLVSSASRDTAPRNVSREGTFTALGWVTNDLDHAFTVVAELGANVLVAACSIPRRSADEFLNRMIGSIDEHGLDVGSPSFPAAREIAR